jgi:hypothetical protein
VITTNLVTGVATLDLAYRYDAVGNRREIRATSGGTARECRAFWRR